MQVWYKWVPRVQRDRCRACGLCEAVCPLDCLGVVDGFGAMVKPESCTSEAACVVVCPTQAITTRWMRLEGNHTIGRWRLGPTTVSTRN
ncbi:MAG: 4Fe-4S binding protein [Acidobacteriia bacterium]|nr:4Fe-4S binding protein [Terriglobia bacterium]